MCILIAWPGIEYIQLRVGWLLGWENPIPILCQAPDGISEYCDGVGIVDHNELDFYLNYYSRKKKEKDF